VDKREDKQEDKQEFSEPNDPQVPVELANLLKRHANQVAPLTRQVDAQIAQAARQQFQTPVQAASRGSIIGLASAAAVALATTLVVLLPQNSGEQATAAADANTILLTDLNQSGQIDIADLLILAKTQRLSQRELDTQAHKLVQLSPVSS